MDAPAAVNSNELKPISIREVVGRAAAAERSAPNEPPKVLPSAAPIEEYRVGAGDVLSIMVWNHPALAGMAQDSPAGGGLQFTVDNDGSLFFPYAGTVRAAGRSIEAIRHELTRRLEPYVKTPQVSIQVARYVSSRAVIVGEVNTPGTVPLTGRPVRVLEAIAHSGGIRPSGTGSIPAGALLTGPTGVRRVDLRALLRDGDMSQNLVLRAGDVLHIEKNRDEKVFVLGEVRNPQTVPMEDGRATLAEALSAAGGPDPQSSSLGNIYVLRGRPESPAIYHLDMQQADALLLADVFSLEPRDVVYVSTAPVTRWNRVLSQLMPSLQTIFYINGLAR